MKKPETMTVPEFAELLGVARNTVTQWVQSGKVKGTKKGPFPGKTSPILIPISELERVQKLMSGDNGNGNGSSKS